MHAQVNTHPFNGDDNNIHVCYCTFCNKLVFFSTEKEQQEAIEHIDEVQNEIDR